MNIQKCFRLSFPEFIEAFESNDEPIVFRSVLPIRWDEDEKIDSVEESELTSQSSFDDLTPDILTIVIAPIAFGEISRKDTDDFLSFAQAVATVIASDADGPVSKANLRKAGIKAIDVVTYSDEIISMKRGEGLSEFFQVWGHSSVNMQIGFLPFGSGNHNGPEVLTNMQLADELYLVTGLLNPAEAEIEVRRRFPDVTSESKAISFFHREPFLRSKGLWCKELLTLRNRMFVAMQALMRREDYHKVIEHFDASNCAHYLDYCAIPSLDVGGTDSMTDYITSKANQS